MKPVSERERAEQDCAKEIIALVISTQFTKSHAEVVDKVWGTILAYIEAARREERERIQDLLTEINTWCSGENEVSDGEDAEDALRYIQDAINSFLDGKR